MPEYMLFTSLLWMSGYRCTAYTALSTVVSVVCMRDAHFRTKLKKTLFQVGVHENCCVISVEK